MSERDINKIHELCFERAGYLIEHGYYKGDLDIFQISDLLISLEEEKFEKEKYTDSLIDYNDDIISIEEIGPHNTYDITVSGDNLFYCNNILTKNSIGLPQTVDFLFAMMRNEELDNLGQVLIKQLKSRFNDINYYRKFVIGLDISKFTFYDVDSQKNISDSGRTDSSGYKPSSVIHKPNGASFKELNFD